MKMIWPGRALGVALLVPALASLTLFISEDFLPLVMVIDTAVAALAVFDLLTLWGAARISFERRTGLVCSLDEPGQVELILENQTRLPRFLSVRDDVPDRVHGRARIVRAQASGQAPGDARLSLYSQTPRNLSFRAGRRLDLQPPGLLAPPVVMAASDRGPGLSRHPSARPLFDAGAARPAEHDRAQAVAAPGNR